MVRLKLRFGEDIRRISVDKQTNFKHLVLQIRKLLNIKPNEDIVIKWLDEDGDKITLSSDLELLEAMSYKEPVNFYISTSSRTSPFPEEETEDISDPLLWASMDASMRESALKMQESKKQENDLKKAEEKLAQLKLERQKEELQRKKEELERRVREEKKAEEERRIEESKRKAEEAARREAEVFRLRAEEAKRRAEEARIAEENKRREEEARRRTEEESKRREEEEAKRKMEELRMRVEEAKRRAEEEAKRKAEEESRIEDNKRREEEARRIAEEEAARLEEARRMAEEEARRMAEEARKKMEEEEARRNEELKKQEEERLQQEVERKREEELQKFQTSQGPNWVQYKARNGRMVSLNLSDKALTHFGVQTHQRVNSPFGQGTVLGVDKDHQFLWFLLDRDMNSGASYWDDIIDNQSMLAKGVSPLETKVALFKPSSPSVPETPATFSDVMDPTEREQLVKVIQESLIENRQREIYDYYTAQLKFL